MKAILGMELWGKNLRESYKIFNTLLLLSHFSCV